MQTLDEVQHTFVSVFLTVVVVLPVDNDPVVFVVNVRLVAVNCLFTESLICFSVSAPFVRDVFVPETRGFGAALVVGDFESRVVGGFGLAVAVLGELAVVPIFDCTVA